MIIDSHCHLDLEHADLARELERARLAGVETVVCVGTDLDSSRRARAIARAHPGAVVATAGVHPHAAGRFDDADWPALAELWSASDAPQSDAPQRDAPQGDRSPGRAVGIGEAGLDYFYNHSERGRQQEVLRRQLEAAGEVGLPVVLHIRDAFDDAFALLEAVGVPSGGVVHCFSGGVAECERALALGLDISISGLVTFPSAKALREAARRVPADRLHVETDAPFLAPVPHRGRRNEPAWVIDVARALADLRGISFEILAAQTRANTRRLFDL